MMGSPKSEAITKRKEELARLVRAFDDAPVGPEDRRYYAFHEAPGKPRGIDPVQLLRAAIEIATSAGAGDGTCQLFSGFRGSGKSTELLRLRAELVADGYDVILVEGASVINLHRPLEPADLLVSIAVGVGLVLQAKGMDSPAKQSLLGRFISFLQDTDVNLKQFDAGVTLEASGAKIDLAKLVVEMTRNPSFKAQVQDKLRGHLSDLVNQFRDFMAQVRERFGKVSPHRCPVLIVDDLEKVRGTGPEQDIIQKGMEQIFWQFAWALRVPGWHVIWTAPPYLQLLNSSITSEYDRSVVLPMIRVWENNVERSADIQSISAVKACLRRRGDVDSMVFKESQLDRLITVSSGHIRDLMALLREVAMWQFMQQDPSDPLNEIQTERILGEYANTSRRAVYDEDLEWLKSIAEKRELTLPNEAKLARASKLIDTAVVMTYRNGETWFDISYPAHDLIR
jgi:hypothetical protein